MEPLTIHILVRRVDKISTSEYLHISSTSRTKKIDLKRLNCHCCLIGVPENTETFNIYIGSYLAILSKTNRAKNSASA